MRSEDIHIGTTYTMKVGRNTIRVTVTEELPDGGWRVKTHTGRTMTIRTMTIRSAERFIAPADAPEATETPALRADATEADPTPDQGTERDTGEQDAPGADAGETGGTMSLLDAAAHLLGQADGPMQCKDLVGQAREQGLWAPKRGGKTPDRTLYAAILREINTKGEDARFRKIERGRFALKA